MMFVKPEELDYEGIGAFNPHAYYDKQLDCIRVYVRDCSTTEKRVSEIFTLLEDNYPEEKQTKFAGLTIKGVSHLLKRLKLKHGVYAVTFLIDKIAASYPSEKIAAETIHQPFLDEAELQVSI